MTRIVGSAAAVSIGFIGVALVSAPAANAAKTDQPVVLSAPNKVDPGQMFTLNCKIKPKSVGKGWKGATAVVHEKGVAIHASRVIGKNGNCTMQLNLTSMGKHKLRVVAIGKQNVLKSQWLKITVG